VGIFGAVCTWVSLIQLAGSSDPIFGIKESPKWAAGGAVGGILLIAVAVSHAVKHFKEDDSDTDRGFE